MTPERFREVSTTLQKYNRTFEIIDSLQRLIAGIESPQIREPGAEAAQRVTQFDCEILPDGSLRVCCEYGRIRLSPESETRRAIIGELRAELKKLEAEVAAIEI